MKKFFLNKYIFPGSILLFTITLFSTTEFNAQNSYYDSVFTANEYIYKFQFRAADSSIQKLRNSHPGDYLPMLLSANYYWWLIITGHDDDGTRDNYYHCLNNSLSVLNSEKKTSYSDDSLYALITTFAYKARIHSMNFQYFSALAQLNNCIDLVKQSFGKEQEYEWFLLTSGLYNYYVEAVKKNYPFLIPYLIFLPEGSTKQGTAFLEQACSSENILLQAEANYFLMKIYLEEEKIYPQARTYAEKLIKKYPANLLYRYYLFRILLEENKPAEAAREFGLLKYQAEKNPQLSETQKLHFQVIAREELKRFYMKEKK